MEINLDEKRILNIDGQISSNLNIDGKKKVRSYCPSTEWCASSSPLPPTPWPFLLPSPTLLRFRTRKTAKRAQSSSRRTPTQLQPLYIQFCITICLLLLLQHSPQCICTVLSAAGSKVKGQTVVQVVQNQSSITSFKVPAHSRFCQSTLHWQTNLAEPSSYTINIFRLLPCFLHLLHC